MAIQKKDGTTYTLRGPNPLMKTQDQWGAVKLHNLIWNPDVKEDTSVKIEPIPTNFKVKDILPPPPLEPEPPQIPIVERVTNQEQEKEEQKPTDSKKISVHCLPMVASTVKDNMYGESRPKWQYGQQYLFEAIVVNQGDIFFRFWTNIEIERGSIIYPLNNDRRWWKVNKKEAYEGGWLHQAVPSDIHPDFT